MRTKKTETEYRVSIYGRKAEEWDNLAAWVVDHDVISPHNRFLIQLPRLYSVWKKIKSVATFQEMLENIFKPLFDVTRDPSKNPKLHKLLLETSGFDSVDDESKLEKKLFPATGDPNVSPDLIFPQDWDLAEDPPYSYYMYFTYANIFALNQFRKSRGMNVFDFRPHGLY
jgi:AMP deaminase